MKLSPMFEKLSKYLVRIGIDYEVIEDGKAIDFEVTSTLGSWNCLLSLHEKIGLGCYSTILTPVPRKKYSQMALYLMYLNNNQIFGNFELDFKTGDVRFKTYLDCNDAELTERLIDRTMLRNVKTMQQFYPYIVKIIKAA